MRLLNIKHVHISVANTTKLGVIIKKVKQTLLDNTTDTGALQPWCEANGANRNRFWFVSFQNKSINFKINSKNGCNYTLNCM